jgi:transposase
MRSQRSLRPVICRFYSRIVKLLEAANIKLSSVVSKIYGVSSLALIKSLLEKDKLSREEISQLAKGKLKKKVDLLEKALNGKITEHIGSFLRMHLENIDHIAKQIRKTDEEIQRKMSLFRESRS